MNSISRLKRPQGFTLIEVMIAMAILTFIALGIYQSTTETFKLRDVLQNEGEFYNGIRMAMDIFQRDITLLYSPISMLPAPAPSSTVSANGAIALPLSAYQQGNSDNPPTSQYWVASTDPSGIRPSHFIGTDTKMSFVATSHIRIYKDAPESEMAKISYTLEKDPDNPDLPGVKDTLVLVKSESPDVFEEDDHRDKEFHQFPLLHGIKKLVYKYYRKDKDTWLNSWDSDQTDTKDIYPDMVEVTIDVKGIQDLSFTGVYRFRPEVPFHGLDPST